LKSTASSDRFFTFAEMTALLFSWGVPTLSSGTLTTAAIPVPLSATSSAIEATTIAGAGRCSRRSARNLVIDDHPSL
jgi:hypothetical protein